MDSDCSIDSWGGVAGTELVQHMNVNGIIIWIIHFFTYVSIAKYFSEISFALTLFCKNMLMCNELIRVLQAPP